MSTVNANTAFSASQYYQLGSQNQGATTSNTSSVDPSLASFLQAQDSTSTSSGVSDLLDLSPEAQSILDGLNGTAATAPPVDSTSSFILTPAQQQQITAILSKYKDAPQTQATYEKIQNDLTAVGLGPQQLSMEDSINSFSITQVLVNALDGTDAPITTPSAGDPQEQSKSANYMNSIVTQWQSMAAADAGDTPSDTMAAGGA